MFTIKKSISILLLFFNITSFSQEKLGALYIIFDKEIGDKKYLGNNEINFILQDDNRTSIHRLTFLYEKNNMKKSYSMKMLELNTGLEAIEKVNQYLEKKVLECEKQNKGKNSKYCLMIKNPPAYYYNDYFDKIYIYEKLSDKDGILYEVKWNWSIE